MSMSMTLGLKLGSDSGSTLPHRFCADMAIVSVSTSLHLYKHTTMLMLPRVFDKAWRSISRGPREIGSSILQAAKPMMPRECLIIIYSLAFPCADFKSTRLTFNTQSKQNYVPGGSYHTFSGMGLMLCRSLVE